MAHSLTEAQALNLSDGEKCLKNATHSNQMFCLFHAKQCHGLYMGYKRRSGKLDTLQGATAPAYFKSNDVPLAHQTFNDLTERRDLQIVHDHLYEVYVTVSNIIEARRLHHKHFYSYQMDYGHQAYLGKLANQRHVVLGALERIERRTAEVIYRDEKWLAWVKQVQEAEETARDKEQKKVKQEAALFRRHEKALATRLRIAREREEKKRQDAYLEAAYQKRIACEPDNDDSWDPIEDFERNKRDQYLELIRHFLWMEQPSHDTTVHSPTDQTTKSEEVLKGEEQAQRKKRRKKTKPLHSKPATNPPTKSCQPYSKDDTAQASHITSLSQPSKGGIESEEDMRRRLSEEIRMAFKDYWPQDRESVQKKFGHMDVVIPPMEEEDIDGIISDIKDIKLFLLCRVLLGQAPLLPAALRANSVEEFLSDMTIPDSGLRDLCLKLEQPSLQDVRDACADFARENGSGSHMKEELESDRDSADEVQTIQDAVAEDIRYRKLYTRNVHFSKLIDGKAVFHRQNPDTQTQQARLTVCGKALWNHASEKAMSRDGWLQFSIMAKDCHFTQALHLCRNWAELSELSTLTYWKYFPASNWIHWGKFPMDEVLIGGGFFLYFAELNSARHDTTQEKSRKSKERRKRGVVQTRNIIAGHMKRNDPVSARFIEYLRMFSGALLVMVRDGVTGRILTAPSEKQWWVTRTRKHSQNEYENVTKIGPCFFECIERVREWRLGFDDHYDIMIWDLRPNLLSSALLANVTSVSTCPPEQQCGC